MAVALCYLATQVKWPNTQNRIVNSKNAMPTKFIFSTFQFIFLSFKTLLFVSTKQTLPCNLASKFTAFFLKWTVVITVHFNEKDTCPMLFGYPRKMVDLYKLSGKCCGNNNKKRQITYPKENSLFH